MAHARIVQAVGTVDGSNRVFTVNMPYVPGSTAYILNGTIHSLSAARGPSNPFGYVESNPDTGEITVDNAPDVDDVVQIFFWDRLVEPAPAIDQLVGVLRQPERLVGVVRPPASDQLVGVMRKPKISGVVSEPAPDRIVGVGTSRRIVGVLKEGC